MDLNYIVLVSLLCEKGILLEKDIEHIRRVNNITAHCVKQKIFTDKEFKKEKKDITHIIRGLIQVLNHNDSEGRIKKFNKLREEYGERFPKVFTFLFKLI